MKSHYFASCAFGWKTAETRDEAIRGLIRYFATDLSKTVPNQQKNGEAGTYIWSCEVKAPKDAKYDINFYQPQGVKIKDGQHHFATYVTQKKAAYCTMPGKDLPDPQKQKEHPK